MPTPIVRDAILTMRASVPEKRLRVVIHSYDAKRAVEGLWWGLLDRALSSAGQDQRARSLSLAHRSLGPRALKNIEKLAARWRLVLLGARFVVLQGRNHLLEHEGAAKRFFDKVQLFLAGRRCPSCHSDMPYAEFGTMPNPVS